jgi:phosphoglycolate phosphatase-like HAD superfamily hydrolase
MRSVIWDLGGTLLDTYPDVDRALSRAAFGDQAPTHIREVAALTRISSRHAITELARLHDVDPMVLREAYDQVKDVWRDHPAPVMAGAKEVIDTVHRGGGGNFVATHRDRRSAEQLIHATGLWINDMVCTSDGYARKPSPQMYSELMTRHDLHRDQVLVVGDRPADVEAAATLGIPGYLLTTPGIPLTAGRAPRIGSLRDLIPILRTGSVRERP